jgi:cupin 2 domain-containing protein
LKKGKILKNIFSDIPHDFKEEFIEPLVKDSDVKIDRIVSRGHSSDPDFWYNQDENEFVLILQGEAKLKFKDEKNIVRMQKGDYMVIPAHKEHRIKWTPKNEDTLWLTVHF